jgi:hypothetical protein
MFGRKVDRRRGRRHSGDGTAFGISVGDILLLEKVGLYCIGRGADGAWSRNSRLLVLIQKMTSGQAISQDVL